MAGQPMIVFAVVAIDPVVALFLAGCLAFGTRTHHWTRRR